MKHILNMVLLDRRMPGLREPRRDRSGVAAIEFALTLPFLFAVLLGIVELSLLQSRTYVVSRAARDACRIGSGVLEGPDADGSEIKAAAIEHAEFVLATAGVDCSSGCEFDATWEESDGWMMLTMQVGVPYDPFTGFLPMIPGVVRSEFHMLTQQQEFGG